MYDECVARLTGDRWVTLQQVDGRTADENISVHVQSFDANAKNIIKARAHHIN